MLNKLITNLHTLASGGVRAQVEEGGGANEGVGGNEMEIVWADLEMCNTRNNELQLETYSLNSSK